MCTLIQSQKQWKNSRQLTTRPNIRQHRANIGMYMRACPKVSCLLPCMKKAKKICFHIIFVLIVTGIHHAFQYCIIRQTVEPDGKFQQEGRRLCSNAYSDKAYGLKCKQISLLPQLLPENGYEPISSHYLL